MSKIIDKQTQACRICNEKKTLDLFEIDKRYKSGYTTRCKACKFESNTKPAKAFRRLFERQDKYPIPVETYKESFEKLYELNADRCTYCFQFYDSTPEFDHITPLSLGGRHVTSNFAIICKTCNSRKGNKPLLVFYEENPSFHWANLNYVIKVKAHLSKRTYEEVEQELQQQYDDYMQEHKTEDG
ncbi:HNH endonuclease [Virgibacillus sp. W0430]|uniref:HNH endonuclease n=1 Tax=Virgibacillus sp. W0430 TaxID=3391580 RepID=UPI003F457621